MQPTVGWLEQVTVRRFFVLLLGLSADSRWVAALAADEKAGRGINQKAGGAGTTGAALSIEGGAVDRYFEGAF